MFHFYYRIKQLIILFFCGLLWQGCKVINPAEQIPTYIHVDSFIFDNCISGVTTSSRITSVAAYYNNGTIGFFDLPATIPILATGSGVLALAPAIAVNGLNNLTSVYPFYQYDTSTFTAQPGKIIYRVPHTCFYPAAQITKISDFSGATGFARWAGNRDILTVKDDSLVFEGGGGTGRIWLTAVGDSSIDSTIKPFVIPAGTSFIEFNYKSTIPFYVGLEANLGKIFSSGPDFRAGISPSYEWKKFYLNVADFNSEYQGTSYNFYIKAVLDNGQTSGRLLIDNIQLVTF